MNKITLSVVALSAIGAPVQMHAAELTADQKGEAINALQTRLSRLLSTITSYDDAIRTKYMSEGSGIQNEIDALKAASVVTQEEVDTIDQKITALAKAAEDAQRPYATRIEIESKYNALKAAYDAAVAETEKYENVTKIYKKYYEDLGVEALGKRIAAYDLGTYDIVNDKQSLLDEINKINAQIKAYSETISKDNESYGNSEASHQLVVAAIAEFQTAYDKAWAIANDDFTVDIYKDWRETLFGKLIEQLNIVNKIKKSDEDDALAGIANENSSVRVKAVNDATAEVETIIKSYTKNKAAQETAKAAADEAISGHQTTLDGMKAELKKRGLTDCDADINAAQALIDALKAKVDEAYKAHTVSTLETKGDLETITKAIVDVDDNNKHKYQAVLDNYDAYVRTVEAIDANQKLLDEAVKAAETESNDKKYKAIDHFTKTVSGIQEALKKLKDAADKDRAGYNAVKNEQKATEAAGKCGKDAGTFKDNAAEALNTYNTIEAAVTAAQKDLDALKETAKDLEVTVTGEVGDKTYGTAIAETEQSISDINAAVDAANAKGDAEHLKALKAINATVANASELAGWTESYADNKTKFDKESSWAAAGNMLADARRRVEDVRKLIGEIGNGVDLGNMSEEIAAKKKELTEDTENGLFSVGFKLRPLEDEYSKAKTDEEQNAVSTKVFAAYADIINGLTKVEAAAAELAKQAETAVANKKAYDETVKLYADGSDVVKALAALETEVEKATDPAKAFYTGELTKLQEQFAKIKENVEKTYAEHKSVDGKDGFANDIKAVKDAADALAKKIVLNENAHTDQLSTIGTLKDTWQKVYDKILADQTSVSAGYLSRLMTESENIKALEEAVAAAFAKGESADKNTEFINTAEAISKAITAIANEQADGYSAAIIADNAAAHELFLATYKTTYSTFGGAVDKLNQFSNIKNEALKTALEKLLDTHNEIYAYAELLRTLKDSEQKAYDANVLANLEKPAPYDATVWIGTAEQYAKDIDEKLLGYQNEVNKVAYEAFSSVVTGAEEAVKTAEADVKDFKYGQKDAFKEIKDVIAAAKTAAGDAGDGVPTDRMYAVNVDTWMETLGNYAERIDADLAAAYAKEKTGWLGAVEKLYNEEAEKIGKLGNIDNADYLKQLEEKYNATYGAAKELDKDIDPATEEGKATIMQIVALCKQYYADDEHSEVYNDAKEKSDSGADNLKAYNDIIKLLDAADERVAAATDWLNAMYIAHESRFPICTQLQGIVDQLLDYRKTTEEKNALNACVAYKKDIEKEIKKDGNLDKSIKALKELAITQSLNAAGSLKMRIDAVQAQYNQVAKEDLDAVKGYEEKIAAYNDELTETEARWKEGNLKGKLDDARAAVLDLESRIVATYDELLKMQTGEGLDVTAIIDEALGKADSKLAEVKSWADYNDVTGELGDDIVAYLTGKLDAIKAYKAEKEGNLHFYKDNILADIDRFIAEADQKCSELKAEYEKQKANDEAYTVIGGKLDTLVSELEKSYATLKTFTHISLKNLDEWKEGVDEDIAGLKKSLDSDHDGVLLTKGDQYDEDINKVSTKIATNEKTLKLQESNGIINDVDNALAAALTEIKKHSDADQYSDATKLQLITEYNRIKDLIKAVTAFNTASYNNGKVENDINGEKLEKPQAIDYSTEAWEAVTAQLSQLSADIAKLAADADDLSYVTGDVDGDGTVTVNDYSEVRKIILDNVAYEDLPEAKRFGADANGDNRINVADMAAISNIIFHGNPLGKDASASASKARVRTVAASASADDELTLTKVSEETGVFGKTVRIAVNVSHVEAFTAGQFDITLPAGMKLAGQSVSGRADGHEVTCSETGANTFRTVVAGIDNNEFLGRDGAIVYLDIEVGSSFDGNASFGVSNIVFTDAKAKNYTLGAAAGGATGIEGIEAATVKERVYSVGGQLLKAVNKGLNIIVGNDGKTKKILKK